MKIGIDASRANKPNKTGTEWYSYYLIQEFKKIDQQNQFFLYTNKKLEKDLGDCPKNFQEKLLKWPPLRFWTWFRLSAEMAFGKNIPDVLFVPAHTLPLVGAKKNVVTIHDVGFAKFPELYQKADIWYHQWAVKHSTRMADKIITISEYSKKDLIELYHIDEHKIKVIYNGYDENFKQIDDQEKLQQTKDKYGINSEFLLFVGRLEEKKNMLTLIKAFKLFQQEYPSFELKLVLAGRPGFSYDKILAELENDIYQDKVIQPGWVEQSDLPLLMNAAKAFIFPSLFEGFGIPILEAMACGTPVISSNVCSLPEVGQDACLYFDPQDAHDLKSKIEQLMYSQELQEKMIASGLLRVKQFSWQKCAQETLDVLLEIGN